MNYSEAGGVILADLVTKYGGQWWDHGVNLIDCLHEDERGGKIFVGGWQAAENLSLLQENKITHVVNCTTDLACPHQEQIKYLTFDVSCWSRQIHDDIKNLCIFLSPLFQFIDDCLSKGESVLVHCLRELTELVQLGLFVLCITEVLVNLQL